MADATEGARLAGALALAARAPGTARQIARLPVALSLVLGCEKVTLSDQGPQVSVQAPSTVWGQCLDRAPAPGFQSIGALLRGDAEFRIEGDALPAAQCLAVLETLVESARQTLAGSASGSGSAPAEVAPETESLEQIKGRYLRLDLSGLGSTWVYEESTGSADSPVMLMLHTAGADARQWHGLMTDRRLLQDWRMLAFDLPFHGRSSPPLQAGGDPWRLDSRTYLEMIDAYLDAAGVERALVVGCSMGAAAGLVYLAERPQRTHGAILLEAPYRSPGRRSDFLDHPAVHAGRFSAAWVKALLSPTSPIARRNRASWIYTQAGPGVYEADLEFYSEEFDAACWVGRIDTLASPLWLLTGEYDYSATPADSRRIADAIPGARFQMMRGLGHFPMTENPAALMSYLQPIASAIAADLKTRTKNEQ